MAITTYNRRPPSFPKPKSVVDEIIDPLVKPMPSAVPSLEMATPVPATTVKPVSPVDEIIASPVVAQPPSGATPAVAPAAAGPGPSTGQPPTVDIKGKEFDSNGVKYYVPLAYYEPTPFENVGQGMAGETDLRLAMQDVGLDPSNGKLLEDIRGASEWIPRLAQTLHQYEAIIASHTTTPENEANLQAEVDRLRPIVDGGLENYNKVKNALATRKANTASGGPTPTVVPDMQTPTGPTVEVGTPPAGGSAEAIDRYNQYKTDPSSHPDGLAGWMRDRDAARAAGIEGTYGTTTPTDGTTPTTPQTEPTGGGNTTVTEDQKIGSDSITNSIVDPFLEKLIKDGYELSAEEESTIRRQVDTAMRSALSGLSARGLGRSSEAAGAIVQGEIAKEQQVGEARARVRKEGTEAGLRATEMIRQAQELNLNKTVADRNYQLASAGQNLEALKNEQGVGFQERAMQLKELETNAAIATMQREFGLKLDAQEWEKFKQGEELKLSAIDLEGTQRLQELKIVNDYALSKSDQEIQQALGISKLELETWISTQQVDIAKLETALDTMFKKLDLGIEREKIAAALAAADSGDGDAFTKYIAAIGALLPLF